MSDLDNAPTRAYLDLANADTLQLQPTPTELAETQLPAPEEPPAVETSVVQQQEPVVQQQEPVVQQQKPVVQQQEPVVQQPAGGEDGVKLTPEALKSAMKNYAYHHSLDFSAVTEDMVRKGGKALEWSTMHLDMSARGPPAQALQRALKFRPDVKAGYSCLLDSFKLDFRKAWTSSKSFDFITTSRTTENSFRKRRDEVGSFKTQLQIQGLLGGDHPAAKEQAQNYVDMCMRPDLKAGVLAII